MSWTNKAVLAWGWLLTPEEIATLPDEVYEEWLDNEWLISSEATDEEIFTYFFLLIRSSQFYCPCPHISGSST